MIERRSFGVFAPQDDENWCHEKTGDVPVERLRGKKAGLFLLSRWVDVVDELDERRSAPLTLTNTDGDAIAYITDRFVLDRANRRAVEDRLAAVDGAGEPHAAGDQIEIAFFKPHQLRDGEDATVIGHAFVSDGSLRVETNSEARAAALRHTVEEACGELIRHRSREQRDPLQTLAERQGPAEPPHEPTAEEQGLLRVKQRYYRKWLDDSIPALEGKTPREASRSREGRARLDLLLRDMENAEERLPEPARFDVSRIRGELGL